MMADEELSTENEEDLWAAAAEDLAQQKDMLKKAATPEETAADDTSATAVEASPEEAGDAVTEQGATGKFSAETDRILDIPLQLSVVLGRTKMLINDLLQLGQGSVIELTKLVGEPLEVLINEKLVARGEVVVVNEKFGVRITEILNKKERIESMG